METPVIKSGTVINVDGHKVVVIDITSRESPDGRSLVIRAVDKDTANKIQHDAIENEKVKDEALGSLKDLLGVVGPRLKEFFDEKGL